MRKPFSILKKRATDAAIVITLIAFVFMRPSKCRAQVALSNIDLMKIPSSISYEGAPKKAVRYTDRLGEQIVLLCETGVYTNKAYTHDNDGADAEVYAYHYLIKKDSTFLTWRVYDFVKDCNMDLEAIFVLGSFQVTDLNKDGIAEVWVMYKSVCHDDVSPYDMKIIMYQGAQKFALRGQNKVKVNSKDYEGGQCSFDKAFMEGPKEFRDFAQKLWDKNILQVW